MRLFFSRLFPLPFIVVGALTLYLGGRSVYRAKESVTWPMTEGRIQNSTVEYHRGSKGSGTYRAEVLYTFTVEGQIYRGNRVAFGDYGSSNPSHSQHIVNRYPKGAVVPVRYRPTEPDICLLEPGVQGQTWFLPGFGLVFFLAGTLMAVFLPRALKKQETTDQETNNAVASIAQPKAATIMGKPLPPEIARQIADHVFAGNKIAAIKCYREYSGEGLKESRDFVESLAAELRTREPYRFSTETEGTNRVNSTALGMCVFLAVLLAVFLWQGGSIATIKQWWSHSNCSSAPGSHTTGGGVPISSTATNVPPQPQQAQQQPTPPAVEPKSIATNAPAETKPQSVELMDLSGVWHITRPTSLDRKVTLTRIDAQHYKLTPGNLAFQGVYAWDGKTLSMASGNRGYSDLTWELITSAQFTMVKGAYTGATMSREP